MLEVIQAVAAVRMPINSDADSGGVGEECCQGAGGGHGELLRGSDDPTAPAAPYKAVR